MFAFPIFSQWQCIIRAWHLTGRMHHVQCPGVTLPSHQDVPSTEQSRFSTYMDTRGGGLLPLLRDVSSSPRFRVLSGARRPSSCTDQCPELPRFYPRLGEYLLCRLLVFLIQAIISHVLFIVVQFAPTKS